MLVALHLAAVTLAAFLLGWLELLVGRAILPQLGGTPAVWNTCLLFFQGTILAGYAYAHLIAKAPPRVQSIVHATLLLAPLPMLPFAFGTLPAAGAGDGTLVLIGRILLLLAMVTGPAALAVSASAPLFQRWFSRAGDPASADPYFLYAGSNLGTLLGIAGHPLIIEPFLSIGAQAKVWAIGDGVLVVLAIGCAVIAARRPADAETATEATAPRSPISLKLRWFLLSFIPCSLLHGVTTAVTTDVAAVPLLWAIPLGIYLGTYAVAFLPRAPEVSPRLEAVLLPWLVVTGGVSLLAPPLPTSLLLVLHLGGFAATAWALHRRLAAERPPASELTGFYLVVSIGGLCGGVFNALASPVLFDTALEYPAMLVLAGLVVATSRRGGRALQFGIGIVAAILLFGMRVEGFVSRLPATLVLMALLVGCVRAFAPRPGPRFAATVLVLLVGQFSLVAMGVPVWIERSFFAVHRVVSDERLGWVSYLHGTTLHGRERVAPDRRDEPLTYFHRTGPIGALFAALEAEGRPMNVCVLGLGIGTLAAYARPGQDWTFLEIDPAVARIAGDPRWFHYLEDARAPTHVELGDGRLLLADHAAGAFDLLVMDAFSSDSVPVHLLTREAFAIYLSKLAPRGVIALNVTNRFLDLEPVVAAVAHAEGLDGVIAEERDVPIGVAGDGKTNSRWIVLGRTGEGVAGLTKDLRFRAIHDDGVRAWTDDHANILSAIRIGGR